MRRIKDEVEQTRKDLLSSALSIFSQKGYKSTRLEDVAKKAGVTRGAIYYHFGNKAELYMAIIEDVSKQSQELIKKAVDEGGTVPEILSRILICYFNLLEDNRRFREVVELTMFKTGVSPDLEILSKKRYKEAQILVENLSGLFKMAIEWKQVRPDLNPDAAARALLAYQSGIAMLWLSNPDVFSVKKNAQVLVDVFLRGIVPK